MSLVEPVHLRRPIEPARILIFDSGLGGLSVLQEIRKARPDAAIAYVADNAAFPYGALAEDALIARVMAVLARRIAAFQPHIVVIACNTASTLVLPPLRAAYDIPFVGTVPAIKPACAQSKSHLISVLATPGTVKRDYTQRLIKEHASACEVTLVGAPNLAPMAEAVLRGEHVADAALRAEIAPCFVERDDRRTDHVVLGCTHYPLIRDRLAALAPWPVTFVDPAPAIARRVTDLIGPAEGPQNGDTGTAFLTAPANDERLRPVFARFGLGALTVEAVA